MRKETAPKAKATAAPARTGAPDNQTATIEREALKSVLQWPSLVGRWYESLEEAVFTVPAAVEVFKACQSAGDPLSFSDSQAWVNAVLAAASTDETKSQIRALAIEPLPNDNPTEKYIQAVLARVLEMSAGRNIALLKSRLALSEVDSGAENQDLILAELFELESYRRTMREFAIGDIDVDL